MPRYEFLELSGENIGSYKKFDLRLDDQGLVLLTGINGAGKSTPWNVLCHLLYPGYTPKGVKNNGLLNIQDPRNLYARCSFKKDGVLYSTKQFRKHSELGGTGITITENGVAQEKLRHPDAVSLINKIVGIDRQNFLSTVYLAQEHNHVLVSGTPAAKRNYLTWVFNLQRFEQLAKQAAKNHNQKKDTTLLLERLQQEKADIKQRLADLPTITVLKQHKKKLVQQGKQLRATVSTLQAKTERLAVLCSQVEIRDKLVTELGDLDYKVDISQRSLYELKKQIKRSENSLSDLKTDLKLVTRADEIRKELTTYQELPPVENLQDDLEKVQNLKVTLIKVTLPQAETAKVVRQQLEKIKINSDMGLQRAEKLRSKLEQQLRDLERSLDQLDKKLRMGSCPTCKRPWKLTEQQITELRVQRDTQRGTMDKANQKFYKVAALAKKLQKQEELQQQLTKLPSVDPQDVEIDIENSIRKESHLKERLVVARERQSLTQQLANVPSCSKELLVKSIKNLKQGLATDKHKLNHGHKALDLLKRIGELPDGHTKALHKELTQTKKALTQAQQELGQTRIKLERVKQQTHNVSSLNDELLDVKHSITQANQEREYHHVWGVLRDGFNHILNVNERKLLSNVSSGLGEYLKPLFGQEYANYQVELCKEDSGTDLNIMYRGNTIPEKGLSTGQRVKIGLASIFALRDWCSDDYANLLILDEPLSGVDEQGVDGFGQIVMDLKKQISTIVLISHHPEIKGLQFDQIWTAKQKNGWSRIEQEVTT